jgi:antibiotic biosynthesis monooxygenase (ABM) superfamily enzyme
MVHKFTLMVANQPGPGKEAEYNQWYNEVHVPMMFAFKGMKKAARYHLLGDSPDSSRYISIYEFDTEEDLKAFPRSAEFAAAIKDFDSKWKDGGFERKWGASYELVQSWEK